MAALPRRHPTGHSDSSTVLALGNMPRAAVLRMAPGRHPADGDGS
jgi:hypothetical protein